jgi:L-fuculose-phosphate aldolase
LPRPTSDIRRRDVGCRSAAVRRRSTTWSSDDIPCSDYATFGTAELAAAAVRALGRGHACLMANHGMVALGDTLAGALRLASDIETLAAQYWHAVQIGQPHVLDRVRHQFVGYGQSRRG